MLCHRTDSLLDVSGRVTPRTSLVPEEIYPTNAKRLEHSVSPRNLRLLLEMSPSQSNS